MINKWVTASRPKTLPASFVPVLVGSALAYGDGYFNPLAAISALLCALLLQIGSNFTNDLYDFLSGVDSKERKGPVRAVASGLITPASMKKGIIFVFTITFIIGLYPIYLGGIPIIIIGVFSMLAAILYSAGSYPLGYRGWGDILVFIYFGLAGTAGTFYLHTFYISGMVILVSVAVGGLITNILIVNNYRDIDTDRKAGKITTSVLFGRKFALIEYLILLVLSYSIPLLLWLFFGKSLLILSPILSLPYAIYLFLMLTNKEGKELNPVLEHSARLALLYGILLSVGILL